MKENILAENAAHGLKTLVIIQKNSRAIKKLI